MGRPKTEAHWEEMIRRLTENDQKLGPLAIRARLGLAVREAGKTRPGAEVEAGRIPSLRTIGRIQQDFRGWKEADRWRYREFRWPESMEEGLLPWEASQPGLELLWYVHETYKKRPLIGFVHWFWRVSQAAEDAPLQERFFAALAMYGREVFGAAYESSVRFHERKLAYGPWRSTEARDAMREANEVDPISESSEEVLFGLDLDPERIDAIYGFILSDSQRKAAINDLRKQAYRRGEKER